MNKWAILTRVFPGDVLVRAVPYIMLVGGLALLPLAFVVFPKDSHPQMHDITVSIAQSVLAGGVVAVLLNSFRYIGIFTQALHEVMFSDEHLRNRNDLRDIWTRVTAAICQGKFPALSNYLRDDVLDNYVPATKNFYYSRYYRECVISWYDKTKGIVEVDESIELDLEPTTQSSPISYTYWNQTDSKVNNIDAFFKLESMKINGENFTGCLKSESYIDEFGGTGTRHSYDIPLPADRRHSIQRRTIKRICIRVEPFLEYSSHNFILNTTVKFRSKDDDLVPIFVSVGTEDFEDMALPNGPWPVHRAFPSLMFPNQGYILVLQQKFS